jgi:hypothetical protein
MMLKQALSKARDPKRPQAKTKLSQIRGATGFGLGLDRRVLRLERIVSSPNVELRTARLPSLSREYSTATGPVGWVSRSAVITI